MAMTKYKGELIMSKDYYKQRDGRDRFAVCDDDGHYEHRGRAEYGKDGHMTRWDNISPVAEQPGYHHHEWWNEMEGYGHGIHQDH